MTFDTASRPTILIVDDSDDYRSALRMWLGRRDCSVVEAVNGENALEVARASRPDLILMDIGMPERSGISAIYRLRENTDLRDVPVVVITGFENEDLHRDALRAGCAECLTKPVDTDYLATLIERLLSSRDLNLKKGG